MTTEGVRDGLARAGSAPMPARRRWAAILAGSALLAAVSLGCGPTDGAPTVSSVADLQTALQSVEDYPTGDGWKTTNCNYDAFTQTHDTDSPTFPCTLPEASDSGALELTGHAARLMTNAEFEVPHAVEVHLWAFDEGIPSESVEAAATDSLNHMAAEVRAMATEFGLSSDSVAVRSEVQRDGDFYRLWVEADFANDPPGEPTRVRFESIMWAQDSVLAEVSVARSLPGGSASDATYRTPDAEYERVRARLSAILN